MTRKDDNPRRSSQEERRIFRTARLEFVELGRIAGPDAAATEFFESADLRWLANPEVLLAAQHQWPASKRVPCIVLAHQVSPRTRRQAAAGGMFAACIPSLSQPMSAAALYRAWQTAIAMDLNPLATTQKMNLVRACNVDPRERPPARPRQATEEQAR